MGHTMLAAALVLFAGLQDPAVTPDRVVLVTGEEFTGRVEEYRRDGTILLRDGAVSRPLALHDVARLQFENAPKTTTEPGDRVRLGPAGFLTGRVKFDGDHGEVQTSYGRFPFDRADLRGVQFAVPDLPPPELKDREGDLVLWRAAAGDKTLSAATGRVVSVSDTGLLVRAGDGKTVQIPRASARTMLLQAPAVRGAPASMGWFARIHCKNGDKLVGTLRAVNRDSIVLFSHAFGAATLKKEAVHTVFFVPTPRLSVGHVLVCDQEGVREYDTKWKVVWRYNEAGILSARKLDNGNVLIASQVHSAVQEIRPAGGGGGEVVWQIPGVRQAFDASRLPNGNTLLAEYGSSRVSEYEPKNKTVVWQNTKYPRPGSAQRLENGNTLIAAARHLVEVDAAGKEVWSAPGGQPWRAERLDNGHTLIVDSQAGAVYELDAAGQQAWRRDGISAPRAAVRLDDGNTLILEYGQNRIVEVDSTGTQVRAIGGLNQPMSLSGY